MDIMHGRIVLYILRKYEFSCYTSTRVPKMIAASTPHQIGAATRLISSMVFIFLERMRTIGLTGLQMATTIMVIINDNVTAPLISMLIIFRQKGLNTSMITSGRRGRRA